jgi:hypothetical protein
MVPPDRAEEARQILAEQKRAFGDGANTDDEDTETGVE